MIQQTKYITKAINLELIKQQIQLIINKTELNNLITEALSNSDTSAAVKRAIQPLLADSFPQFPDFTNITLGDTAEDGSTVVILKQHRQTAEPKSDSPIQSIEPLVVTEPDEVPTPAYVEPTE